MVKIAKTTIKLLNVFILFLLMLLTTFLMNMKTQREMLTISDVEAVTMASIAKGINLGLLGTLVASLFMSVLFYPVFWLAFALTSALKQTSKKKIKTHENSNNTLLVQTG